MLEKARPQPPAQILAPRVKQRCRLLPKSVTAREIILADGEPILIASDIAKPPRNSIETGPYLVLVAIGTDQKTKGYAALSAYAQPILNGHHFIPVQTTRERQLVALALRLQWQLRAAGVASIIEKPTFDIDTPGGFCRLLRPHTAHSARFRHCRPDIGNCREPM